MKALLRAFNQEKALVGAFSVIVKTDGSFAALVTTELCCYTTLALTCAQQQQLDDPPLPAELPPQLPVNAPAAGRRLVHRQARAHRATQHWQRSGPLWSGVTL